MVRAGEEINFILKIYECQASSYLEGQKQIQGNSFSQITKRRMKVVFKSSFISLKQNLVRKPRLDFSVNKMT